MNPVVSVRPRCRAVIFDWGGTLMLEDPRYYGPMVDWPEVAAVDGIRAAEAVALDLVGQTDGR